MAKYEAPQFEIVKFETEGIMVDTSTVVTPVPEGNETPIKPFADITD
ncbi:MAG: hypothetical protein IJ300_07135 [Clostridia bacterium]|nr:hypothetical protein [Clostridia bacterium]